MVNIFKYSYHMLILYFTTYLYTFRILYMFILYILIYIISLPLWNPFGPQVALVERLQ